MTRTLLPLLLLACPLLACTPNLLQGEVDGHGFEVVDALHFEFRGVDAGTSLPVHDLVLWLMPVQDACAQWPALLADLRALQTQLDAGQDPNQFCVEWADRWTSFHGNEPFWIQQIRMQAQPRPEDEGPERAYPWFDEDGEEAPRDPYFDATFVWHEAPTLERCAAVFEGSDYLPRPFAATGGEVTVDTYVEDARIEGSIVMEMESQGEDLLAGAFDSSFCPAAGEFALSAPLEL